MKTRQEEAEELLREVLDDADSPRVRLDGTTVGVDPLILARIEKYLSAGRGK